MKKLSQVQIYAIRWLHSQNVANSKIADDLTLSEKDVLSTLEKFSPSTNNEEETKLKTASSSMSKGPNNIKSKSLMINHTSGKKDNSVTIMTKEASEVNDAVKKNMPPSDNKSTEAQKSIFRPKNNER